MPNEVEHRKVITKNELKASELKAIIQALTPHSRVLATAKQLVLMESAKRKIEKTLAEMIR